MKTKKTAKKIAKKTMTEAQVEEVQDLKNLCEDYREDAKNLAYDVKLTTKTLKTQKRDLATAEKGLARTKFKLGKITTKYAGWAKPKPAKDEAHVDTRTAENLNEDYDPNSSAPNPGQDLRVASYPDLSDDGVL